MTTALEKRIDRLRERFFKEIEEMTPSKAAEKLDVDIAYVSRLKRGKQNLSIDKLIELSKKLGILRETD